MGDLIEIIRGVSYKKDQASTSNGHGLVPIVRATNIDQKLDFEGLVYVPTSCVSSDQLLRRGDIVIAASSGSKHVVGKAAQLRQEWYGSFGAFCMGLRPNPLIENAYLAWFLQTEEYRHQVSDLAAGSNINNLRRDHIEGLRFSLAPLDEQRRIVAKIEELFSELDAGVAALERVRAGLKRYRAAVLKAAVEGKLTEDWRTQHPDTEPASVLLERILAERRRKWEEAQLAKFVQTGKQPPKGWKDKYKEPPSPSDALATLPSSWSWAVVGQISDIQGGIQKQPSRKPLANKYPFLRVANVLRDRLDLDEVHYIELFNDELTRLRLQSGDLLIVEGNGSRTEIGRAALWTGDIPDCVHQNHIIRVRLFDGLPKYLNAYWNSPNGTQRVSEVAASTSGLFTLSVGKIASLPVPIPPREEQERIVSEVERRLSIVDEVETQVEANLKRAARLRQGILKRAFEGKLVPQDPADEPAEQLLARIRAEDRDGTPRPKAKRERRGPRAGR